MPYFTLVTRYNGTWTTAFGDYDLDAVVFERECTIMSEGYRLKDTRVIRSKDDQQSINSAVARLNS